MWQSCRARLLNGILMAILFYQYPLDFDPQIMAGVFSIPKQELASRKYTDSRVRLVKKKIFNFKMGKNIILLASQMPSTNHHVPTSPNLY